MTARSASCGFLLICFVTAAFGTAFAAPTMFSAPFLSYDTGYNPNSVAIGDLNGDGNPDLAVANSFANTVSVLLADASGKFAPKVDYPTAKTPVSVAIADLEGDGKPDLVIACLSDSVVSVLRGDGSGGFGPRTDWPTAAGPYSAAVADLTGDGKLDLVVANVDAGSVSVLGGDGAGTRRAPVRPASRSATSMATAGSTSRPRTSSGGASPSCWARRPGPWGRGPTIRWAALTRWRWATWTATAGWTWWSRTTSPA